MSCTTANAKCYSKDKACRDLLEIFGNLKTKYVNTYITNVVNATWGDIEGDILNQQDLIDYINNLVVPSTPNVIDIVAGENLLANDFIYIESDGLAYKAVATNHTKEAIAVSAQDLDINQQGEAYLGQTLITGFSSLSPNGRYFLSTTPGEMSLSIPFENNNIVQQVGKAISSTTLLFSAQESILIIDIPIGDYRILESGESRITELGDYRVLEEIFYRFTESDDSRITEDNNTRILE